MNVSEGHAPNRRANKVADWLEASALAKGVSTSGIYLQELARNHGVKETDVALGLNTIRRRAALLGERYPFRTAGGGLSPRPNAEESVWTALLWMSSESPIRSQLDIALASTHLERITACALASLYGEGTQSLRFGWPSEDGRPREFPAAVRWLATRMGITIGASYRPPGRKDGGVDVVAWRPFPDGRSGFPVLLTQCTLERDFAHKADDIDIRVWSGWLSLDLDPAKALAIPDVVASGEEWNSLASRVIVLDRLLAATANCP